MMIRRKLKKFYKLVGKAYACSMLPKTEKHEIVVFIGGGYWTQVNYRHENIKVSIKYSDVWNCYRIEISVQDIRGEILVYKDGWLHDVPKEMKSAVRAVLTRISKINDEMTKNKVAESYDNWKNQNNLSDKLKKKKKHEEEKQRLIKIFQKQKEGE